MTETDVSRDRRIVFLARIALAATIMGSLLALPDMASASTGCQALNQPSLDGTYFGKEITLSLSHGDIVRITAGFPINPNLPGYVPTGLFLILDDVASVGFGGVFPGTREWVVPSDFEAVRLKWITNSDNETGASAEVTWDISCENAPPPADTDPPSVTVEQASDQADPTNGSPVEFTVQFNEPVTGFEASDVILSGSAGATTASVSGTGAHYTVSVTGMANSGDVVASIAPGAATDGAGNTSLGSSSLDNLVTYDITPPVLSLPEEIVVDAAGPSGASVSYLTTATDNDGSTPSVFCTPASGASFPVATTAVSCSATDAVGNIATGGFTVTVRGAAAQLEELAEEVQSVGPGRSLEAKMREAQQAQAADDVAGACKALGDFLRQVEAQRGKTLTLTQADELSGESVRIRSVLGC